MQCWPEFAVSKWVALNTRSNMDIRYLIWHSYSSQHVTYYWSFSHHSLTKIKHWQHCSLYTQLFSTTVRTNICYACCQHRTALFYVYICILARLWLDCSKYRKIYVKCLRLRPNRHLLKYGKVCQMRVTLISLSLSKDPLKRFDTNVTMRLRHVSNLDSVLI